MTFTIRSISASDSLPLRHMVLWPDHPAEHSMVKGDAEAFHFGGFQGDALICVASLFQDGDSIRLRKFATDPEFQGKGFGTQMLEHLLNVAKSKGAKRFWFDARESALPFYEGNGFSPEGARFYKGDVAYRKVTRVLT